MEMGRAFSPLVGLPAMPGALPQSDMGRAVGAANEHFCRARTENDRVGNDHGPRQAVPHGPELGVGTEWPLTTVNGGIHYTSCSERAHDAMPYQTGPSAQDRIDAQSSPRAIGPFHESVPMMTATTLND